MIRAVMAARQGARGARNTKANIFDGGSVKKRIRTKSAAEAARQKNAA
jgi:hypothetical protein